MKSLSLVLSLFFAVSFPTSAQDLGSTLTKINQSGVFTIGYRIDEPPLSFRAASGHAQGYSVELCEVIATSIGQTLKKDIQIEYVTVNAENRFDAVESGKIDILCGSTTKTLDRMEQVDFSQLTFLTGASLMFHQKQPISSLSDLQGKSVAVVQNTTTEKVLRKQFKASLNDAKIVKVDSAEAALRKLISGDVAAFASDQIVILGLLMSGIDKNLKFTLETFSEEPFALAVRKNDSDFRLLVDGTLSQLSKSGRMIDIYAKWFPMFKKIPPAQLALFKLNQIPE